MIKKKLIIVVVLAGLVFGQVFSAVAGETFPDVNLSGNLSDSQKSYLGLKDGAFRLADVAADYLVVEGFSMYCPICQRDAPVMNEVYDSVTKADTKGRIKFIGIGLGNTPFEIAFFQKKYNVAFPLVPDEDYTVHKALGEVGTPAIYLLKVNGGSLEILYAKEGEVADGASLVKLILDKTGLNQ